MLVTPVSEDGASGVQVHGLDLAAIAQPEIADELRRLWIEHGLMVFRGVEGPEFQLELSRVFGPLQQHPLIALREPDYPELANIHYDPDTGDVCEVEGRRVGGYLHWHSDLIYVDKINRGGILRPVKLPESGGETGFIDQILAYETLPPHLQGTIDDLWVIYESKFPMGDSKFGKPKSFKMIRNGKYIMATQQQVLTAPRVLHPMVFTQVETGRKVLNVSPWFCCGIWGHENAEGDRLLAEIVAHIVGTRKYFHSWKHDDMVLWDNWRMVHSAAGVPPTSTRWMQRTTIEGDYAFGRTEHANAVIDDRLRVNI